MDYTKQTNSVLKTLDATQSMNSILLTKEFIEHTGRKGMKWYQNVFTSGSKSINSTREAARSINTYKGNKRKQKTLIKTRKKVSTMSNKELQDEINRMKLRTDSNCCEVSPFNVEIRLAVSVKFASIVPAIMENEVSTVFCSAMKSCVRT